jgi:pimeloyl-ACP methyl ester carboxylesterase
LASTRHPTNQRIFIMIDDPRGRIEYNESGTGSTVVLLPGSCSTSAVWRPVIAAWDNRYRSVTTSLLGYGGTAERRSGQDASMLHEAEAVEQVIAKAGGPVHLVGHSFGGLVALSVALRNQVSLASLTILEAPGGEFLREAGEDRLYETFLGMRNSYFASHEAGDREAIAAMIDFYSGPGTFVSWPAKVRAYAVETTPVNMLDWASAYDSDLSLGALATIDIPVLALWGGASHPAMRRANALIGEFANGGSGAAIEGAAHFMLGTHPGEVARLIGRHVDAAEARASSRDEPHVRHPLNLLWAA